ncbi:uncharacterized protein LOC113791699 [Dermatophagoides pteronyssinus]|uniref:Uncharacterized protein LOC113791699 n=1 Tax=Dermatophagoides pteronyssinus TaxID=6956 RepID=A0A6P6XV62_DERPT|nr:uncharacterized protein LOC113791699 [Dermatophagoides pteronyssinus]
MSLIEIFRDLVRTHNNCVEKFVRQFEKLFNDCFLSLRKQLQETNQQVDDGDGSNNTRECKLDQIRSEMLSKIRDHFREKFNKFLRQPDTREKLVIIGDYCTVMKLKKDNDRMMLATRKGFREDLQKIYETRSECRREKQQYLEQLQDNVRKNAEEILNIRNQLMVNLVKTISPDNRTFDADNFCDMVTLEQQLHQNSIV